MELDHDRPQYKLEHFVKLLITFKPSTKFYVKYISRSNGVLRRKEFKRESQGGTSGNMTSKLN